MKVAVINFSGNVGKSTIARHLLAPRLDAPTFAVETLNAGASDSQGATIRVNGKAFGDLQEELMRLPAAIVDVGASNVEPFIKLMGQFDGSHEEFDYFVVPTVSDKKQQADTVNTIKTLSSLGVSPDKIKLLFNKVEVEDVSTIEDQFAILFGFQAAEKSFTLNRDAVIFNNEIYDRIRSLGKSVADVVEDSTDYRAQLRDAADVDEKEDAIRMISAQRLAKSAHQNLNQVYQTLFVSQP